MMRLLNDSLSLLHGRPATSSLVSSQPDCRRSTAALLMFLLALMAHPSAAAPVLRDIQPRALQTGATTVVAVIGQGFDETTRVVVDGVEIANKLLPGNAKDRRELELTVPANVPPGIRNVRVVTRTGISQAQLIALDPLPTLPFSESIATLPIAFGGELTGTTVLKTSFTGRKGEHFVAEIEARRFGGNLDPLLAIHGPDQRQLAWSQAQPKLGGDTRLELTLPADGVYTVELHDIQYNGQGPGMFRLKMGNLAFADFALPLGVTRGKVERVALIGHGPADAVGVADLKTAFGSRPVALPTTGALWTSSPASVVASEWPEFVESAMPTPMGPLAAPMAISGRIGAAKEEDRYTVTVTPGAKYQFNVLADRIGSPLDGVLSILRENGQGLGSGDESEGSTDPMTTVDIPKDVSRVVVVVRDLLGRGGDSFVYRLEVSPAGTPDFSLDLETDRPNIPREGADLLRVSVERNGYNGPIALRLTDPLPAGVRISNDTIPAGASEAFVTLTAESNAPFSHLLTTIVGEATEGPTKSPRIATRDLPANQTSLRNPPWLRSEVAVGVTPPGPLGINWANDSSDGQLPIDQTVPLAVTIARRGKAAGKVRLTLLTSQDVPLKKPENKGKRRKKVANDEPDTARAIRLEKPVELAADQTTATLPVIVPADLPRLPYDVAVLAEMLAPNGMTVMARATTPARRLLAGDPIRLDVATKEPLKAISGGGSPDALTGAIARIGGFDRPVTVSLDGLPPDLPSPSLVLDGKTTQFSLPLLFPYGYPAGTIPNVRVVASTTTASNKPVRVEGAIVPIVVSAGSPPPPAGPLVALIEDDPAAARFFHQGPGTVAVETADRYSGPASLRFAKGARGRDALLGWHFAIRENPEPGAFRYVRFAVKKVAGSGPFALEWASDGKAAPTSDANAKKSRRYHFGAEAPDKLPSVSLAAAVPTSWTVVTRDLFADFGEITLTGLTVRPGDGEVLLDHVYLARTTADFEKTPAPLPATQQHVVFDDNADFITHLNEGGGQATLETGDRHSGSASVKVTPDQRYNPSLPGLGLNIREKPGAGEYRYLSFAWKKKGGNSVCLQLNHDGAWGPGGTKNGSFRYHAGPGPECYGASLAVNGQLPGEWTVVTRDLFADFGEFTLTGIALSPVDGEFALYDRIVLGQSHGDVAGMPPAKKP